MTILLILILFATAAVFVFYRIVAAPELEREGRSDDLLRDCLRALDEAQTCLREGRREDALLSVGRITKHQAAIAVLSDDPKALGRLIACLAETRVLEEFVALDLAGTSEAVFNPLGECLLKHGHPILCLAAFGHKQSRDEEFDYPLLLRAVKAAGWKDTLRAAGHPGGWWKAAALMGFISFIILLINATAGMVVAFSTAVPCIVCAIRSKGFPSEASVLNEQVTRAFRQISPAGEVPLQPSRGPLTARPHIVLTKSEAWLSSLSQDTKFALLNNLYIQVAILCPLSLISGTILRGHPTQFLNLVFVSSLIGAFACGFRTRRCLFFLGLAVGTNLLARAVFAVDSTASRAFYYGFAAMFFDAGSGLIGAVLGFINRRFEAEIYGKPKEPQPATKG